MRTYLRILSSLPRFRRDVNLLLVATGAMAVSFFGIQQLLKILYIVRLDYGPEYLGLFNASGAIAYMSMSLPAGAIGDRLGLTRTMLIGALLSSVGMAMLPFTEYVAFWLRDPWPILSQLVVTAGYAMYSINLVPALMAVTSEENRNSAYAFSGALRSLGTFVGTIVGGLLPGIFALWLAQDLNSPGPYRISLWLSAALSLFAVVPLMRIGDAKAITSGPRGAVHGAFPVLPVGILVIYVCFSQAANAVCQSFCNAFMDTELHMSTATIGLITGVGQFAAIFLPILGPWLARRHGHGWTLMIVSLGSGLSLLPLFLFPNWGSATFGRFGTVALAAMWMPTLQVYQMEMIEQRWRSLAYGTVSMAMGLSFGTISLTGGYVATLWGYPSIFLMAFCLSAIGAGIMAVMRNRPILTLTARSSMR